MSGPGIHPGQAEDGGLSRLPASSPFLHILEQQGPALISETPHWFVLLDSSPARPGHMLVVPRRQFTSYFEIKPDEWTSLHQVIVGIPALLKSVDLKERYTAMLAEAQSPQSERFLSQALRSPALKSVFDDFTIAIDEGAAAGRTVEHLHIHFVPRTENDVPDPQGGFRWMFPGDGGYVTSFNALNQSLLFYNNENLALQYFRQIREMRGAMPYLEEFMYGVAPSPENRVAELGFGPGIELEWMLSRGYHIDGVDISGPMNIQLQRILDKHHEHGDRFAWRDYVRLFPYSLQEFPVREDHYVRVWSQATFLHLDRHEIAPTLSKFGASLKRQGRSGQASQLYVNFKVGESTRLEIDSQGRPFSHFTEASFREEIMPEVQGLKIARIWVPEEADKLGRAATRWLNVLLEPK